MRFSCFLTERKCGEKMVNHVSQSTLYHPKGAGGSSIVKVRGDSLAKGMLLAILVFARMYFLLILGKERSNLGNFCLENANSWHF